MVPPQRDPHSFEKTAAGVQILKTILGQSPDNYLVFFARFGFPPSRLACPFWQCLPPRRDPDCHVKKQKPFLNKIKQPLVDKRANLSCS